MPTDNTLERLRSQALKLSEQERSELAHSLIPSLDAPADESVEAAEEAVETIACYKNERSGLASIFQRRMHALSQTWVKACTRHSEIPFMDKRASSFELFTTIIPISLI